MKAKSPQTTPSPVHLHRQLRPSNLQLPLRHLEGRSTTPSLSRPGRPFRAMTGRRRGRGSWSERRRRDGTLMRLLSGRSLGGRRISSGEQVWVDRLEVMKGQASDYISPRRHVNNVVYLSYFETARLSFLRSLSPPLPPSLVTDILSGQNVGFVVKSHFVTYKVSIAFPSSFPWRLLVACSSGLATDPRSRFFVASTVTVPRHTPGLAHPSLSASLGSSRLSSFEFQARSRSLEFEDGTTRFNLRNVSSHLPLTVGPGLQSLFVILSPFLNTLLLLLLFLFPRDVCSL